MNILILPSHIFFALLAQRAHSRPRQRRAGKRSLALVCRNRLERRSELLLLLNLCSTMFGSRIPAWAATATVVCAVVLTGTLLLVLPSAVLNAPVSVAFIGNSYLFMNDVPRLMETLSSGKIRQDSCIHPSGTLVSILQSGSGVYGRWQTKNAAITESNYTELYDYGACTVIQLINGSDENLTYYNSNGAYHNDGYNPCLEDYRYLRYLRQERTRITSWDFVVLADMTKRMAFQYTRNQTMDSLEKYYVPLLLESGATPIVVETHAFWSEQTNMTGLESIPTFGALINEGAKQYIAVLQRNLPDQQRPILAKIGIAYLTVYKEQKDLYAKLFYRDSVHASLYGTFLLGCVLHCAIYGNTPSSSVEAHVKDLFANARRIQGSEYPTQREASYLMNVAERVMLHGYVPKFFDEDYGESESTSYSLGESNR